MYVLLWGPVRAKDVGCEVPIARAEQIGHCPGVWRDKFFERGLFFFLVCMKLCTLTLAEADYYSTT